MKKIIFCFLISVSVYAISAQAAPDWLWTQRGGGSFIDTGFNIATDSSGNSYITGPFYYDATFGSSSLISNGEADMFVAKIDADGNWLWAVSAGGTWDDYGYGYGIAVDAMGNCYVSGYFYDNAVFGADTLNGAGNYDCYVAKLDTNGNWLWARRAGGPDYDSALSLAVDDAGNCYVTGWFSTTAAFGVHNLTSAGGWDIFAAKLDANGNWLWAKRAGGTGNDVVSSAVVDAGGNCYLSGYFNGTTDFGFISLNSSGNHDVFAAKLDTNGNWLWAVKAGGVGNDYGNDIAIDHNNCCLFLTGSFKNSAQFGSSFLTSNGESDIFVAKLDADGNWLWATHGGGVSNEEGLGVSTDSKGNCYVTGEFYNDIQFGVITLTGNGNSDVYIAKLAGPTPKTPQNLVIEAVGTDIMLTWNAVTEDKDGQPLTLDYYEVYYCQDHPYGVYISLGQVSDSTFVHSGAALSDKGFYYVRAVIAD